MIGEVGPEALAAFGALLVSALGAVTALVKVGPERQTSLVGAQDTVIENLREEVDRQRRERERAITELEAKLAAEAELCERRIGDLQRRIAALEAR